MQYQSDDPVAEFNQRAEGRLPGLLGIEMIEFTQDRYESRMMIEPHHHAPNGFLHAASIVALADTTCGFAARTRLPEGSSGFTTVELKSNHMGTLLEGELRCTVNPVHIGRSTQVWDARVFDPAKDRTIAVFRCTQMVLWPKAGSSEGARGS